MRALIAGLSLTLLSMNAAAQEASAPVNVAAPAPDFDGQIMMGYNQCLDAREGLPAVGHGEHLLVLWQCQGRDNQRFILSDGVLYAGAERAHRIEVMSSGERCGDQSVQSARRSYRVGICRSDDLVVQRRIDYDAAPAFIGSDAPLEVTGPSPGDPLVVRRLEADDTARLQWEYVRETRQLRARGTELCITPPSRDSTDGAPLYLDQCAEPHRAPGSGWGDGRGRSRVELLPASAWWN